MIRTLILLITTVLLTACAGTPRDSYALQVMKGLEMDEGLNDVELPPDQYAAFRSHDISTFGQTYDNATSTLTIAGAAGSTMMMGTSVGRIVNAGPLALVSIIDIMSTSAPTATRSGYIVYAPQTAYPSIDAFERATVPDMRRWFASALQEVGATFQETTFEAVAKRRKMSRYANDHAFLVQHPDVCRAGCTLHTPLTTNTGGNRIHGGLKHTRMEAEIPLRAAQNAPTQPVYAKVNGYLFHENDYFRKPKKQRTPEDKQRYQLFIERFNTALVKHAPDNVIVYLPPSPFFKRPVPLLFHKQTTHFFVKYPEEG